jgi:hypothetical protein
LRAQARGYALVFAGFMPSGSLARHDYNHLMKKRA